MSWGEFIVYLPLTITGTFGTYLMAPHPMIGKI